MNKKDISIAVMATYLVLEILGRFFGGFVEDITDKINDGLQDRIQLEQFLQDGG